MSRLVPLPATVRDTLLMFSQYDEKIGLSSITDRIDFSRATWRRLFRGAFGRPPNRLDLGAATEEADPRETFTAFLQSKQFQEQIREIAVRGFPEKRRQIFVHVPKCAGSDLTAYLTSKYPTLHLSMTRPRLTDAQAFLRRLKTFSKSVAGATDIAFCGHTPLPWYIDQEFIRAEDEVYTIVRHPLDLLFSRVSYMLTNLTRRPDGKPAGDVSWLRKLGLKPEEVVVTPERMKELGSLILHNPRIIESDLICRTLGRGSMASAIECLATANAEITDTRRYSEWRLERFGASTVTRRNKSMPLFTADMASAEDLAHANTLMGQDILLFNRIKAGLDAAGTLSIRGNTLA